MTYSKAVFVCLLLQVEACPALCAFRTNVAAAPPDANIAWPLHTERGKTPGCRQAGQRARSEGSAQPRS